MLTIIDIHNMSVAWILTSHPGNLNIESPRAVNNPVFKLNTANVVLE